jgi:hypothetical protein
MKTTILAFFLSLIPAFAEANRNTVAECRLEHTEYLEEQHLRFEMIRKQQQGRDLDEYVVKLVVDLAGAVRVLEWSVGLFDEAPKLKTLPLATFRKVNYTFGISGEMTIVPLETKHKNVNVYAFFSSTLDYAGRTPRTEEGVLICAK